MEFTLLISGGVCHTVKSIWKQRTFKMHCRERERETPGRHLCGSALYALHMQVCLCVNIDVNHRGEEFSSYSDKLVLSQRV